MDVGQTTQAASGKVGNPSSTEGESKQSLFLVAHHQTPGRRPQAGTFTTVV